MNAPPTTVRMNSRSMMLAVHLQLMKRVAGTTTTTASTIQIATTMIRMTVWSTAPGTLCQERWRRSRLWPAAMFSDLFPLEAPGRIVSLMTTILAARHHHHHHLLLPRMNERVELRKKIPERMKIAAVAAAQIRKVVIMNQVLRVLVMASFARRRASMKTRTKMKIQISRWMPKKRLEAMMRKGLVLMQHCSKRSNWRTRTRTATAQIPRHVDSRRANLSPSKNLRRSSMDLLLPHQTNVASMMQGLIW